MKILRVLGATILASSLAISGPGAPLPLRVELESSFEVLTAFVSHLEAFRSGENNDTSELLRLGQAACDEFGRCDVLALAQFYSGLSEDERAQGILHEQEFDSFWERVREASAAGLDADAWSEARAPLLLELADLAQRAGALADPAPAARALSLSSRLGLAELQAGTLSAAAAHDLAIECREKAERSEALFSSAGYVTPRLEPLWLAARLDRLAGQSERARQGFGEVLHLAESVSNVDFQLHALSGLSDLARERGDSHGVDLCLSRMAALRPPSASGPGFQLVLRHAMRLIHQDEPAAALAFLKRHQPESGSNLSSWHLARASALTRLDDLDAALEAWREAEELADNRDQQPSDRWNVELVRARIELAAGRYGHALRILDRCATESQLDRSPKREEVGDSGKKETPPEIRLELHAMRGEALLHLARHDAARRDLERALELGREINASLEPDDSWSSDAGQAGALSARANVLGEALGVHRLTLLAEANLLLGDSLRAAREIETGQSTSLRRGEDRDFVDVASWAESVELGLVTWAVGPDETIVCDLSRVGRRGEVRATGRVVPVGRSAVARAVRRLREAILSGEEERAIRLGKELSSTLFPLTETEPLRRGRRIYSLHGPLEELPLEWMLMEGLLGKSEDSSERRESPRTIPLVLPGLPASHPGSPADTPLRWTLLGDPRGAEGELLLPGSQDELLALAKLHPGALELRGADFTKDAVIAALQFPTLGTGALHIATHLTAESGQHAGSAAQGIFGGESGLLCSRGEQIAPDDLLRAAPHYRLAVLSACTTGGGLFVDGEGLHGVARALLVGGTRNVVVTLWPVEDRAAQRFSLALHRSLSAGRAPSVAVHEARIELRKAGHPAADWAAFRLLGRD